MADPAPLRMNSAAFLAWARERPEGEHFELVAGVPVAMAPERSVHALTKFRIARHLAEAVEAAGLPCTVYPDGMMVEIEDGTVYEPDVMLRCGPALPDDALVVTDPMVLVEVRSPSTAARDAGAKLEDYFRLPSLRHYLIVKTENRAVIHHARDAAGVITTRIVRDGALRLDPPGVALSALFG